MLELCTTPSNPDVAGIGIRVAIYTQALLAAVASKLPSSEQFNNSVQESGATPEPTSPGPGSLVRQATIATIGPKNTDAALNFIPELCATLEQTLSVTGLALVISAMIEARSKAGLTDYHALVVLNLSILNHWAGINLIEQRFGTFWKVIPLIFRGLRNFLPIFPLAANSIFVSVLGFWFWLRTHQFQRYAIDSHTGLASCQITTVYWAFGSIPVHNRALRIVSLIFYLPGFTFYFVPALSSAITGLLSCAVVLIAVAIAAVSHIIGLAYGLTTHTLPKRLEEASASVRTLREDLWDDLKAIYRTFAPFSSVIPVVYYIVSTELLIWSNSAHVEDQDENHWTFGQFMALFTLFIPIYFQMTRLSVDIVGDDLDPLNMEKFVVEYLRRSRKYEERPESDILAPYRDLIREFSRAIHLGDLPNVEKYGSKNEVPGQVSSSGGLRRRGDEAV